MANCFDYLMWRGDIPFSVSPLNEVDGMLLSRLSYAPLELVGQPVVPPGSSSPVQNREYRRKASYEKR